MHILGVKVKRVNTGALSTLLNRNRKNRLGSVGPFGLMVVLFLPPRMDIGTRSSALTIFGPKYF